MQNSDSGTALLEFLVSSGMALALTSLAISSCLSFRSLYEKDLARTELMQNARPAFEIMSSQIRQAGENCGPNFPAIEVLDGQNGASDVLILRRNLLDEVLKVCQDLYVNTSDEVIFAQGSEVGCIYADNGHNFTTWKDYRLTQSGTVKAYVLDSKARKGEFFDYRGELDTGTQHILRRGPGNWSNDYNTRVANVYMIEEWKFQLSDKILQLSVNQGPAQNVVSGITDMQIEAVMKDDSTRSSYGALDPWMALKAIRLKLALEVKVSGETHTKVITSQFVPRNLLSY